MWVIKLVLSLGISWTNVLNFIRSAIDLIAVWFLLYYFISMFKSNMKTMQLFKGVLFILIVKLMTSVLGLTTLNFLVDSIINWGVDRKSTRLNSSH